MLYNHPMIYVNGRQYRIVKDVVTDQGRVITVESLPVWVSNDDFAPAVENYQPPKVKQKPDRKWYKQFDTRYGVR